MVDAEGSEAAVAERIRTAMTPALRERGVMAERGADDLTGAKQETS